jgi:predicted nucleic acid-binding protein
MPRTAGDYLFDTGVIVLAIADTDVSDGPYEYLRAAVYGEIDVVIPTPVLIGAYHILVNDYDFDKQNAEYAISNILERDCIEWWTGPNKDTVEEGLKTSVQLNIEGWDGYYAHIAEVSGISTIVGIDDDLDRIDGIEFEHPMSQEEKAQADV